MFKILIIEDNVVWHIKLQVMLEEYGFSILLVTSLSETKQVLVSEAPQLILAGVCLPDGSALDYFKTYPIDLPIVFVTEFDDLRYVDQALSIPFFLNQTLSSAYLIIKSEKKLFDL